MTAIDLLIKEAQGEYHECDPDTWDAVIEQAAHEISSARSAAGIDENYPFDKFISSVFADLHKAIAAAVQAEREACAKVAESNRHIHGMNGGEIAYSRETAHDIAAAIRARNGAQT